MRNILFLLMFFLCSQAAAGQPECRQLAEEIVEAQELSQQIAELQTRFTQAALGEVEGLSLDSGQKALAKELRGTVLAELVKTINWTSIKDDIVGIYVSEYSEAELRQIRDFLVSPAGKKYREKIPLIKERISVVARERMLRAMPEILTKVSRQLLEKQQQAQ